MNIFVEDPKNLKPYFLHESWWFSQFIAAFLWRISKRKLLLASMKSLTNSENPPSDPLQMLWSGDLAKNTLKGTRLWSEIDTGSRLGHVQLRGFFLHSIRGGHWSKSFTDRKGSWNRNFLYNFSLDQGSFNI